MGQPSAAILFANGGEIRCGHVDQLKTGLLLNVFERNEYGRALQFVAESEGSGRRFEEEIGACSGCFDTLRMDGDFLKFVLLDMKHGCGDDVARLRAVNHGSVREQ